MLIFKKLTWLNFLSTGNNITEIQLDRHASTLIIGMNGAGKSTILDALTFALFGKPFRNINKPSLCNSINGKGCVVTIEFEIGTAQYKIVRGIKPGIFEIYLNGVMINQDAAVKDYQKVLEQQILRLNYKTFTQVIILGSASFVPFMQLPAYQRREVIEDILDIGIFSTMNSILKERISQTKEEMRSTENKIEIAKTSVIAQKKIITSMISSKQEHVDHIRKQIADNGIDIKANEDRWEELSDKMDEMMAAGDNAKELKEDIDRASAFRSKLNSKKEHIEETLQFFSDNTICPSCSQDIPHEHKINIGSKFNKEYSDSVDNLNVLQDAYDGLIERQKKLNDLNKELLIINAQSNATISANKVLIKSNKTLNAMIEVTKQDTSNIDVEKQKLKQVADDAIILIDKKNELASERNIQEVSALLLKDTGIKTAIIKEYLPVMNKLINGYLTAMDFYVHFELDESFNEVIKSRFRDEFTYDSFSEGEKQKIDLALLFAWRQIAKMKNSVNTNLLILDEIFDSSLDNAGTDMLMNLLYGMPEGQNIFVISHKGDILIDKFHSVIKFEKKNDFSSIV